MKLQPRTFYLCSYC